MKSVKKKVLFCLDNLKMGGIPRALENLFANIDHQQYDVKVYSICHDEGYYKSKFMPYLLPTSNGLLKAFSAFLKDYKGAVKVWLVIAKAIRKICIKLGRDPLWIIVNRQIEKLSLMKFDTVIAYSDGMSRLVSTQVDSPRKILWLHMDYKNASRYYDTSNDKEIFSHFDYFVSPSEFSKLSFVDVFPEFASRAVSIPNFIDEGTIRLASTRAENLGARFKKIGFTIISVGRVCYEKRFFEIPAIAKKLKEQGCSFQWFIVGSGSPVEYGLLLNNIAKEDVSDAVIPIGAKENPYPYIASADLLVSLSFSETFSYAIYEAKILGTPVLASDFGASAEIIGDGTGLVVPFDEVAEAIARLIGSPAEYGTIKTRVDCYHYDNTSAMKELEKIL